MYVPYGIALSVMCSSSKPRLKFRSYNPQTEVLKEKKLPKAKPENGMQYVSIYLYCVHTNVLMR